MDRQTYITDITDERRMAIDMIRNNDCEQLKKLLKGGLNPNMKMGTMLSHEKMTCLLSSAVRSKNIDIVNLFLRYGADPNIDVWDFPAMVAIMFLKTEILKLLIDHGANINIITKSSLIEGQTPLHDITLFKNVSDDLIELIIKYIDDINAQTMRALSTPLHYAANGNNLRLAKHLIDAGADVTIQNVDGRTALDIAKLYEYDEMAEYIELSEIPVKGVHGQGGDKN